MHLHATGEMESIRYSAARWRAQTSYWGIAEKKRDFLETFSWVEEPRSCVSYPCEAGNRLLRLFLTFGHICSGVCVSPSQFNSTHLSLSVRVASVQGSPSVLWETSTYPVPAKKRVHLFAGSTHISPLAISPASLQPVLKPRNAEGRARD